MKLVIAAHSARSYAQAAVACGYEVITLDAFADLETRNIARWALQVPMDEQGVDVAGFKQLFSHLMLQLKQEVLAGMDFRFVYAGLFDTAPELLHWVATQMPLIGNTPEVLAQAKSFAFFPLLDTLKIKHPEVCLQKPKAPTSWLAKRMAGSGGLHIKPAVHGVEGDYYQRNMLGQPVSLLFVADGETAQVIGFNWQYVAPTATRPYRFAGAVSHAPLAPSVQHQFMGAAQQLTTTLGLRGINSLDAILERDTLFILELNPRLSASFGLYRDLFSVHLQSSQGKNVPVPPQQGGACAQLIVYAEHALEILADFVWPVWATDIPNNAVMAENENYDVRMEFVRIPAQSPICTVWAHAEDAQRAQALALTRVNILRKLLYGR